MDECAASERRQGEAEDTLRALMESISEAIVVVDALTMRIRMVSRYAADLAGHPREELEHSAVGQQAPLWELLHLDGASPRREEIPLLRAIERGETVTDEVWLLVRPDGQRRRMLVNAVPIRDAEGRITGAIHAARDIVVPMEAQERERLLGELQEANERLFMAGMRERDLAAEAKAALRARDEFLAVAAHELKTPITSLRGRVQLTLKRIARQGVADPAQVSQALEVIDRQADRLSILASQLIDLVQLDAGDLRPHKEPTDLVPLANKLVQTMQVGTSKHHLTLQAPLSLIANVDPARLQQVLYNLIDNAIRYSPEGSPVEVELSAPDAETVRFAVRDYGIGVPPEQRERIFTRFFQAAERPAGGLGLGLYAAQRLTELHGGHIRAEFPEDGGSRFVVELPREAES